MACPTPRTLPPTTDNHDVERRGVSNGGGDDDDDDSEPSEVHPLPTPAAGGGEGAV